MNFPLLNIFLEIMWFFLWIMWFFLLFRIAGDIFRSPDLSGWGRAGWLLLGLVLPLIGVLAYLIVRGNGMSERENARAQAAQNQVRNFVSEHAQPGSAASELLQLAGLHDKGVITDEEFAAEKARVLA